MPKSTTKRQRARARVANAVSTIASLAVNYEHHEDWNETKLTILLTAHDGKGDVTEASAAAQRALAKIPELALRAAAASAMAGDVGGAERAAAMAEGAIWLLRASGGRDMAAPGDRIKYARLQARAARRLAQLAHEVWNE